MTVNGSVGTNTDSAPSEPHFELDALPVLSRTTVDRTAMVLDQPDGGVASWSGGRVVTVDRLGRAEVDNGALVLRPAAELGAEPPRGAVALGEQDGTSYWAVRPGPGVDTEQWGDLRMVGAVLGDTDADLLTTAVSLLAWHSRANYCAVCGARTAQVRLGWARRCTGCDREEYPRTDAAVICLVHDGADHVLLARQPVWPPERYSVLAGFVEAGESLESCVQREIKEEVGIEVDGIRYLGSQPWPFPRSLMLGFAAIADRDQPLRPADGEIEDAHWVHRDRVRAALAAEKYSVPGLRLPPEVSIAFRMLKGWAQAR